MQTNQIKSTRLFLNLYCLYKYLYIIENEDIFKSIINLISFH